VDQGIGIYEKVNMSDVSCIHNAGVRTVFCNRCDVGETNFQKLANDKDVQRVTYPAGD
jgi:hypothetical protein